MDAKTRLYDKINYDAWKQRKRIYDRKQCAKKIALKVVIMIIEVLIVALVGYIMIFALPGVAFNLLGLQ